MFKIFATIRSKVIAGSIVSTVIFAVVIGVVVTTEKANVVTSVDDQVDRLVRDATGRTVKDVYLAVRATHEALVGRLEAAMVVAADVARASGGVTVGQQPVTWRAVSQVTGAEREVVLPQMQAGGTWLGQVRDPTTPVPVVDRISALTGVTATVFQRMNPQGDMLRVATTVRGTDGLRATGSYIPAVDASGAANPVVAAILKGEMYRGTAIVVSSLSVTLYRPLLDTNKQVIGMLYVGLPVDSVASLRQSIVDIDVGKSGYVYVVGGSGAHRGRYILSAGGKRDGEDLWDSRDDAGHLFIQSIVAKALATKDGSVDYERYPWKTRADGSIRPGYKVAAVTYFEPWDWVIGAGAYEDDYAEQKGVVESVMRNLVVATMITALVLVVVCTLLALLISRSIHRGIVRACSKLRELAGRISAGELDSRGDPTEAGVDLHDVVVSGNEIIEAFVPPLRMTVEYVDNIARGTLPPPITEPYRGEFDKLKVSLNQCIANVAGVMGELDSLIQATSAGDLTVRSQTERFSGSWRNIIEGLNGMLEPMHDALVQVAASTQQVGSAATLIATGSQSVAQAATSQAASLEETSSSLDELASMTRRNAEHAREADALATSMRSTADKGATSMTRMTAEMTEIRAAAQGTAQIIKDINEIAFQTNLLALNAAVEAARAGDAGRGFAVVAEEVRSLARRSKEAAHKTEALIQESVRLTQSGESITRAVSGNLSEIVEAISSVAGTVGEIAAASQEQARGIDQLNQAVASMNGITQQNVSSSEESSAAAEELATQAEELDAMVGRFQLRRAATKRIAARPDHALPAPRSQVGRGSTSG